MAAPAGRPNPASRSSAPACAALAEVARARRCAHLVVERRAGRENRRSPVRSSGGFATALGLALGGERVALFLGEDELAASAALAREAVRAARSAVHLPRVVDPRRRPACRRGRHGGARPGHGRRSGRPRLRGDPRRRVGARAGRRGARRSDARLRRAGGRAATVALLGRLLGRPADSVHSAGVAERELFGEHRRRIPRWHDATRAIRLGGELGPQAGARRLRRGADLLHPRPRRASGQRARPGWRVDRTAVAGGRRNEAGEGRPRDRRDRRFRRNRARPGGDARALGSAPRRARAPPPGSVAGVRARGARRRLPQDGGGRTHRTCCRAPPACSPPRCAGRSPGRHRARHARRGRGGGVARRWRPRRRLSRAGRAFPAAASRRTLDGGERGLSQAPGAPRPVQAGAPWLGRSRGAKRTRDRSASRRRRHRALRTPAGQRRIGARRGSASGHRHGRASAFPIDPCSARRRFAGARLADLGAGAVRRSRRAADDRSRIPLRPAARGRGARPLPRRARRPGRAPCRA